jgi:polyhydroxyalkanoate synthase
VAFTPGQVVFRNELVELIQYRPQTEQVHAVPLLASSLCINKYYVMDLAPGRFFVEWAAQHGHTTFCISYRNPDRSISDLTLEDYLLHRVETAMDQVQKTTGAPTINVVAVCPGGALAVMMAAHLAQTRPGAPNSLALLNTLLDYSEPGVMGMFTDPASVDRLEKRMLRAGYLDGRRQHGRKPSTPSARTA